MSLSCWFVVSDSIWGTCMWWLMFFPRTHTTFYRHTWTFDHILAKLGLYFLLPPSCWAINNSFSPKSYHQSRSTALKQNTKTRKPHKTMQHTPHTSFIAPPHLYIYIFQNLYITYSHFCISGFDWLQYFWDQRTRNHYGFSLFQYSGLTFRMYLPYCKT